MSRPTNEVVVEGDESVTATLLPGAAYSHVAPTNAALTMMEGFRSEELREPRAAFYHGIFLAVAKESAPAREFLEIAATAALSPDEKSLLLRMKGTATEERKPPKPVAPVENTPPLRRDAEPALR